MDLVGEALLWLLVAFVALLLIVCIMGTIALGVYLWKLIKEWI